MFTICDFSYARLKSSNKFGFNSLNWKVRLCSTWHATRLRGQMDHVPTVYPLRCCVQPLVPLRHGDNILRGFNLPPLRSSLFKTRDSFCYSWNPPAKCIFKKKTGTVWATARVSSNRGIRTKVFERMCHTMPGVREASSFVPEIGTADTSDKRATNEEYS